MNCPLCKTTLNNSNYCDKITRTFILNSQFHYEFTTQYELFYLKDYYIYNDFQLKKSYIWKFNYNIEQWDRVVDLNLLTLNLTDHTDESLNSKIDKFL